MRRTADDRKNALITDLIAARQSLLAAVASVPPEQVEQSCIGFWCVKDLLAHVIGWDETNQKAVQEILDGERPSFFQYYDADWQSYNASLVAHHRSESMPALLSAVENSHHRFVEYLNSLTASQVLEGKSPREKGRPVTIRNLLRAEAEDERKHAEQVQAFLKRISVQIDR